jgi:hypothetical protein
MPRSWTDTENSLATERGLALIKLVYGRSHAPDRQSTPSPELGRSVTPPGLTATEVQTRLLRPSKLPTPNERQKMNSTVMLKEQEQLGTKKSALAAAATDFDELTTRRQELGPGGDAEKLVAQLRE